MEKNKYGISKDGFTRIAKEVKTSQTQNELENLKINDVSDDWDDAEYEIKNIEQWAQSTNTSIEIAEAISEIASSSRTIQKIWDNPTNLEFRHVLIRADELANHETDEMTWGGSTITIHTDNDITDFGARYDF